MLIYKIFDDGQWRAFQDAGESAGAPIDLADGYVHLSTGAQLAETLRLHFAAAEGLMLLALDSEALGHDLLWEASRGRQDFPHLYRHLRAGDVLWSAPLPVSEGLHILPKAVA